MTSRSVSCTTQENGYAACTLDVSGTVTDAATGQIPVAVDTGALLSRNHGDEHGMKTQARL